MQRLELIFGMGRKGAPEISDAEWRSFLDAEVTPRFPDGLTVLAGDGQWRNKDGQVAKESSRIVLVWLVPAVDTDTKIEAIRSAWKLRHAQESVMRIDGNGCVSF